MKPHRIRMTHNLLLNYGLYRKMEIYVMNQIEFRHFFFKILTLTLNPIFYSVHIRLQPMK